MKKKLKWKIEREIPKHLQSAQTSMLARCLLGRLNSLFIIHSKVIINGKKKKISAK